MYEKTNILSIFTENPERWFHLREFSKVARINVSTAKKYLEIIHKEGMILRKKERNLVLYKANRENPEFINLKKFYLIGKIIKSGLLDFIEKEYNFPPIILYGSASKGEDSENSDIDIFVLSEKTKHPSLAVFEKKLKRSIHLIIMNKEDFRKAKISNKYIVNNLINGIMLSGFLEVF